MSKIISTDAVQRLIANLESGEDNSLPPIKRNEAGLPHSEDGPAIVSENGGEEYWENGKLHRIDGPAWYYPANNDIEWWVRGVHISNWKFFQARTNCSDEELFELKLKYGPRLSEI